jgi:hypothetical protein
MQLALRGLSAFDFGDPSTNMACYLDPDCRSWANGWCGAIGNVLGTSACVSWAGFNPTPAQIAANNTNAGPALTPDNQALATQMAQAAVRSDIAANPQNYGELCGTGLVPSPIDGACVACPFYQTPSSGVCVFNLTGFALLAVAVGLLFMAVKR